MIRQLYSIALAATFLSFPLLGKDVPKTPAPETTPATDQQGPIYGTEPLPPLPEGAFTFVVIPDTQSYTGAGTKKTPDSNEPLDNQFLKSQIDWIIANKEKENIVFVSHVGDIVDKNTPEQWAVAKRYISRLHGVIPFGLTPGNHDMVGKTGDTSLFQEVFPASDFKDYPWYIGTFTHDGPDQTISTNNANSAQLFSAGGIDFLHINMECNAPDRVLEWAGKLLEQHRDRLGIITTHMDLGIIERPKVVEGFIVDPKGRMRWHKTHGENGNSGEDMWEKLYRHQPNLDFVLSGDQSRVTARRLDKAADDGHTIYALMSDYMSQPVLRLMRFRPDKGVVEVLSYHVKDGFLVDHTKFVEDKAQHEFTIPLRTKH